MVYDVAVDTLVLVFYRNLHALVSGRFADNQIAVSHFAETLESRRNQLTERFFQCSVLPEMSCLHYLLPDKRHPSVTDILRHPRNFDYFKI